MDGERPLPDDATSPALAADEAAEAALETEAALEIEAPVPVVAVPDPLFVEVAVDETTLLLELEEMLEQDRSYNGVVLPNVVTPKLSLGVAPLSVSSRVNQKTLTLPNRGHPTTSQYVLALAREAVARFCCGPLTGHPVSVIQMGFPPTAFWVAASEASKRDLAESIELESVFW